MAFLRNCLVSFICFGAFSTRADHCIEHALNPLSSPDIIYEEKNLGSSYIHYKGTDFGNGSDGNKSAHSGYLALYHGLLSQKVFSALEAEKSILLQKMNNPSTYHTLFGQEDSLWRSKVIIQRPKEAIENYILYKSILCLLNSQEHLDAHSETDILQFAPEAAHIVAQKHSMSESFTVTPHELFMAFKHVAQNTNGASGESFDISTIEKYFTKTQPFSLELKTHKNSHEIYESSQQRYKVVYGPDEHNDDILDGSWLSSSDLRYLVDEELKHPSEACADLFEKDLSVRFLEFNELSTQAEFELNLRELRWLSSELLKTSTFKALYLINFAHEWISCVIAKSNNEVTLIVTDPQNKDRRDEKGMILLRKVIHTALSPQKLPHHKDDSVPEKMAEQKNKSSQHLFQDTLLPQKPFVSKTHGPVLNANDPQKTALRNYDAPLANVPDSDIPSLEELFGSKIPNSIRVLIKQMQKKGSKEESSSTKLKNCLLLYGPPGTGKSTIAQVMARAAGKNIMYAGGGDFRSAMQGSGTELLEALFTEAKKRGNCVIIIDEIDGASARLQPHGSTQEDNRALKKLITSLDQYRYDPDIFVICTTNYAENIDSAVLRRLKCVEIGLPDYAKRKNIIDYYLKKNNVTVASRRQDAVSHDFYDKLISATEGFSGDALGEMINTGVFEFKEELEPEFSINLDFRTKGIDLFNKSIIANIGELALLPLIPLFILIGESNLDKHLYSAYMRQVKLHEDLKKKERKKDVPDKYAKDPLLTRFTRRNFDYAAGAVEQSFWNMLVQAGWRTVFKKAGLM